MQGLASAFSWTGALALARRWSRRRGRRGALIGACVRRRGRRCALRAGARRRRVARRDRLDVRRGRVASLGLVGWAAVDPAARGRAARRRLPALLARAPRPAGARRRLVRRPARAALRNAVGARAAAALGTRLRRGRDRRASSSARRSLEAVNNLVDRARSPTGSGPLRPLARRRSSPRSSSPRSALAGRPLRARRARRLRRARVRHVLHAGDDDALEPRRGASGSDRLHVRAREPRLGARADARRRRRRRTRARDRAMRCPTSSSRASAHLRLPPYGEPANRPAGRQDRRRDRATRRRPPPAAPEAARLAARLRPARRRALVRRRPAAARRQRARGARRRRGSAPAAAGEIARRAGVRAARGLVRSRRRSGSRAAGRRCASCSRRPQSAPTSACSRGPARRCRSSTRRARACATTREALVKGTRIQMALDARERPMHCHHEKLAVIDGPSRTSAASTSRRSVVTGSTRATTPRVGASAGTTRRSRVEGPLVGDVAAHIALRWLEVTGERIEPARATTRHRAGSRAVRAHRSRTAIYDALPLGDFRILEAYVRALRSAQTLIYLESQFLWSPEIVRDPRATSCATRRPTSSGWWSCCRRTRTTATTTRAGSSACSSRRPRRAPARVHALPAGSRRAGLRAREDRDRRRPLAVHRLGEPQRALALQRHRGVRDHLRRGRRARRAPAALARAPAARRRRRRPAARGRRAWRPPRRTPSTTASRCCRTSHGARVRFLGPINGLLVDGWSAR